MPIRSLPFLALLGTIDFARRGVEIWSNPPRLYGARVTVDTEANAAQSTFNQPIGPRNEAAKTFPAPDPVWLLHFRIEEAAIRGLPERVRIGVNQRTWRIDRNFTSPEPFGVAHQSDGAVVANTIAASLALPFGLALRKLNAHYERLEQEQGLSRHAKAFLDAVRHQLPDDDYDRLEQAFKRTWAKEQRDQAKPTFDQARVTLSLSRQFVTNTTDWYEEDYVPTRIYEWADKNGETIAHGREIGPANACYVTVSQSRFSGDQARELINQYSKRTHTV